MTRRSLHEQLRVAFEECDLTTWELSRRANVRESLLKELVGAGGRASCEVLERVAHALGLGVWLSPSSPEPRGIGPVLSTVDVSVMRYTPEQKLMVVPHNPTVLALDLEGVLISNVVSLFPRPGLLRFLTCCRGLFERIVMITTVNETRFRQIANLLIQEGVAPAWLASVEYVTWTGKTKDLRFVPDTEPGRVLLVDDMEIYVHVDQFAQWVRIDGFEPPFTQPDNELDRVLEELARRVCGES